jgi:hypothetical protein
MAITTNDIPRAQKVEIIKQWFQSQGYVRNNRSINILDNIEKGTRVKIHHRSVGLYANTKASTQRVMILSINRMYQKAIEARLNCEW